MERPWVTADVHEGAGEPPAVLLHSLALDRSVWDDAVATLRGQLPLLVCDLPGHGRSRRLEGEASVEWMADRVADHLRAAGIRRAVVAGLSLGGCVAQALATAHPDLVAGLLLVDTTAWYGPDAERNWEARAQKALREGFASLAGFQLDRWFSPSFRAAQPAAGRRLLDVFSANDPESYAATCRALGRFDGRAGAARIVASATVLVGEHDPATPVDDARDLAGRIPGARLRVLEGASHLSPVERPDAFAEELLLLHGRLAAA